MGHARTAMLAGLFAATVACGHREPDIRPVGKAITISPPLGLPPVPVPADNPETAEGVALGRRLFYETKLSANNILSCASCHNPQIGFSDGQRRSVGFGGQLGTRNAPTVVNAAYTQFQFWDGRAASLEEQAGGPISNPVEMNLSHDLAVSHLEADASYKAEFEQVFGPGRITIAKVEKALASFERTLISGNSPFDRYEYGGDKTALSEAAVRGLALFRDEAKGNCSACHTIGGKYALFTDGKFHNIGISVGDDGELKDLGRFVTTKAQADKGAFKTPTLRNVANSAPYMHDGSLKTLKDVVEFYLGGGNSNEYLDPEMKKIHLSERESDDVVEFLRALTGDAPKDAGPPLVSRR